MVIAKDADELLRSYDEIEDPDEPNLMLQEYIPGPPESVWMFNGYFDSESRCLVSFTGRKLRQHPAYTGMTSLGICLRNDDVDAGTRDLMAKVGYRGVVDIGWRYDERDGQYKLLDVNPRLGNTFRLFVGSNGMDVVRALYLDLTGQPVPETDLRHGRKWLVETFDVASSLQYLRDGRLGPLEWARSYRGVEETAWFAKDDPRPFAAMGGRAVRKAGRKLAAMAR
jgi:D-aspartate ligase